MKRHCILLALVLIMESLSSQSYIQTGDDDYTRYELLDPASQRFRILYDVSVMEVGKSLYFNTLRKGSDHEVAEVIDLMSGKSLSWEIVNASKAKEFGHANATDDTDYLKVDLGRPVALNGEIRIRIDKTYRDTSSYSIENGNIVFSRRLGIKRNAVVLPAGYEIVSCNYPSQLSLESDGRIRLSFMNTGSSSVDFKIVAKKLPPSSFRISLQKDNHPWPDYKNTPEGRDKSKARLIYHPTERAFENREIVYFLQEPETHSFRLYHDYTESRVGMDKYLNVVRPGSKASNPSAYILDTGEKLKVETLKGSEIKRKGIDIGEEINEETEVVVIWYPKIAENQSLRLRIEETYTDPNRYLIYNGELIWDRSFGRNRNMVILPNGWWLTNSDIPAIINQTNEGNVQLYFVNDRSDNIDVFLKARRR